jgi:beta-N-acetylglucosaminidase
MILLLLSFVINVNADTTYIKGTIKSGSSKVYLRSCAKSSCSVVKSDTNGSISLDYPETFEIVGEENSFYKVYYQYSGFWYYGYLAKSSVEKEEYTVLDGTVNEFLTMGFDITYAKKLAILKTMHPSWEFVPLNLDITWNEAISGETKYNSTNLIDGTNTSLRSTADGAYDNGTWTTYSGGSWYAASTQTIKYYMDPRNFLNDAHIFMFETLLYNEAIHTEEAVQTLINTSFMKGNTFYYDENNEKQEISYARTFVESGIKNDVSAIHLASRVLLEQGYNGSALSSGTNEEYPGYYNFFNIQANGSTTASVIHNGLAYAQKQGWNSPYLSILGGGSLISGYNSVGQTSVYLQKFDFIGPSYYSHQYMQNIRAPYKESYTTYSTYVKNNLLNHNFTFAIPIFKGSMPEETSLSLEYNEDSTLSSLSISGCDLMPSFTSNAYNYTCTVDSSTSKVVVNAVATSSSSTVTGNGEVSLSGTEKVIKVVVKSASNSESTYQITIKKSNDKGLTPDEILSKLQINNDSGYISGFDLGSDASSLNKLIKLNYPTASTEISSNNTLSTGMTLKLSNNGDASYTIVMYGDNNGDGDIDIVDLLKVQKHILKVNSLKGAYLKASDVNKDGVVDIVDLLKIQKHILNVSKIEQ